MKKKILWGVLVLAVLLGGWLYYQYKTYYTGEAYYVQIKNDGQKKVDKADDGDTVISYSYNLTGYNDQGKAQQFEFSAYKNRPLRRDAYLRVEYNHKRQLVLSWEEVKQADVPKKAISRLN